MKFTKLQRASRFLKAILPILLTLFASFAWGETFDLTAAPSSSSTSTVTWTGTDVDITATRNGSSNTAVNNYLPTTRAYTRLYTGNRLTFTPKNSKEIDKVLITLQNSSYNVAGTTSNCSVNTSGSTTTVTPTTGTSAFYVTLSKTAYISAIEVQFKGSFSLHHLFPRTIQSSYVIINLFNMSMIILSFISVPDSSTIFSVKLLVFSVIILINVHICT